MQSELPFPDAVIAQIVDNSAHAFSHNLVMDAVDVSMALNRHLLVYSFEGVFQIETEDGSWRLPPSRAGWLPAGQTAHTTIIQPVHCISIFYKDDFIPTPHTECTVFSATSLIQEMFRYTLRWNATDTVNSMQSDRFFLTLFDLCNEQMQSESLFNLPKAKSPELDQVLKYTLEHLDENLQLDDLANLVHMSTRSLTRRFQNELYMTWGQYLQQARMMRAMDALAQNMNVTETALEVGFTNVGAFTTAFHKHIGMTPTQFQAQFS